MEALLLWRRARCSVLAGFLKHRREEFYARPCYTTARTHARTHVRAFFLVVCHRGARDLSLFRRFWLPHDQLQAVRGCNRDFAFFAPFRGFDFRCCKILDGPLLFVVFFLSLSLLIAADRSTIWSERCWKNFFESELCVILRLSGSNRERERDLILRNFFKSLSIGSVVYRVRTIS